MGHAAFLQLLLSDEVTRRESRSAMLRARTAGLDPGPGVDRGRQDAGLDPGMRLETWDEPEDLIYDRDRVDVLILDDFALRRLDSGP